MQIKNRNQLTILLQNCFNAPWPKEFNPSAFIAPDGDMTPIESSREFKIIGQLIPDHLFNMAEALLWENEDMQFGIWYQTYLSPIKSII